MHIKVQKCIHTIQTSSKELICHGNITVLWNVNCTPKHSLANTYICERSEILLKYLYILKKNTYKRPQVTFLTV